MFRYRQPNARGVGGARAHGRGVLRAQRPLQRRQWLADAIVPVVIAYHALPEQAISFAGECARTTHGNPECVDACRYFAALLIGAFDGLDKQRLLSGMYEPLPGLWEKHPLSGTVTAIASGTWRDKKPPVIRGSGYVVDCLAASLWAVWTTDSYRNAILAAANLGDDADTTGAVTGQLAGALYGESSIPPNWLNRLAKRDLVEGLAERLMRSRIGASVER
jgi:ADP-ribosylglycohydrolase